MIQMLEMSSISEVLREAYEISGCGFSYKDNRTLKTTAFSDSIEFLGLVRSSPIQEIELRYETHRVSENEVLCGYLTTERKSSEIEDGGALIDAVLLAIRLMLRQSLTEKAHAKRITANLFKELIDGKITSEESLKSRLRLLSMKFNWGMVVLAANFIGIGQDNEVFLDGTFDNKIAAFFPDSYVYKEGRNYSCILALKKDMPFNVLRNEIDMLAEQITNEIKKHKMFHNTQIFWGCGKPRSSLLSLKSSYHEANQSLLLCKINSKKCGNRPIFWSDIGAFRLIGRVANSDDALELHDELLRPFLNSEDMMDTLIGLDENSWNLKNTAQSLSFHYNTMKYRYKKLKETFLLGGNDIDDPSVRFDISVAVRLHKIYKEWKGNDESTQNPDKWSR